MVKANMQLSNRDFETFDLKFDTGFNGELGLSRNTLNRLQRQKEEQYDVRLADGEIQQRQGYLVQMCINGQRLSRLALDMGDGGDLIGMTAFPGWNAHIEIRVNGDVNIVSD